MTKPTKGIFVQQRLKSAWATAHAGAWGYLRPDVLGYLSLRCTCRFVGFGRGIVQLLKGRGKQGKVFTTFWPSGLCLLFL